MTLSIGQKRGRVVTFMRGLTNRRVVGPLMLYAFTQADMDEGWRLLQAATGTKLAKPRYQPPDPTALARLDEWENRWYPIVQATLERHLPDVAESVLLNLAQATGVEVSVSVGTLIGRLRQLELDEPDRSREARALLAKRGLTEAVLAEPETMLSRFQTLPEPRARERGVLRPDRQVSMAATPGGDGHAAPRPLVRQVARAAPSVARRARGARVRARLLPHRSTDPHAAFDQRGAGSPGRLAAEPPQ